MKENDIPKGGTITRRQFLVGVGAGAGALLLPGCAARRSVSKEQIGTEILPHHRFNRTRDNQTAKDILADAIVSRGLSFEEAEVLYGLASKESSLRMSPFLAPSKFKLLSKIQPFREKIRNERESSLDSLLRIFGGGLETPGLFQVNIKYLVKELHDHPEKYKKKYSALYLPGTNTVNVNNLIKLMTNELNRTRQGGQYVTEFIIDAFYKPIFELVQDTEHKDSQEAAIQIHRIRLSPWVTTMQEILKEKVYSKMDADGYAGETTKKVIHLFARKYKFSPQDADTLYAMINYKEDTEGDTVYTFQDLKKNRLYRAIMDFGGADHDEGRLPKKGALRDYTKDVIKRMNAMQGEPEIIQHFAGNQAREILSAADIQKQKSISHS